VRSVYCLAVGMSYFKLVIGYTTKQIKHGRAVGMSNYNHLLCQSLGLAKWLRYVTTSIATKRNCRTRAMIGREISTRTNRQTAGYSAAMPVANLRAPVPADVGFASSVCGAGVGRVD